MTRLTYKDAQPVPDSIKNIFANNKSGVHMVDIKDNMCAEPFLNCEGITMKYLDTPPIKVVSDYNEEKATYIPANIMFSKTLPVDNISFIEKVNMNQSHQMGQVCLLPTKERNSNIAKLFTTNETALIGYIMTFMSFILSERCYSFTMYFEINVRRNKITPTIELGDVCYYSVTKSFEEEFKARFIDTNGSNSGVMNMIMNDLMYWYTLNQILLNEDLSQYVSSANMSNTQLCSHDKIVNKHKKRVTQYNILFDKMYQNYQIGRFGALDRPKRYDAYINENCESLLFLSDKWINNGSKLEYMPGYWVNPNNPETFQEPHVLTEKDFVETGFTMKPFDIKFKKE